MLGYVIKLTNLRRPFLNETLRIKLESFGELSHFPTIGFSTSEWNSIVPTTCIVRYRRKAGAEEVLRLFNGTCWPERDNPEIPISVELSSILELRNILSRSEASEFAQSVDLLKRKKIVTVTNNKQEGKERAAFFTINDQLEWDVAEVIDYWFGWKKRKIYKKRVGYQVYDYPNQW